MRSYEFGDQNNPPITLPLKIIEKRRADLKPLWEKLAKEEQQASLSQIPHIPTCQRWKDSFDAFIEDMGYGLNYVTVAGIATVLVESDIVLYMSGSLEFNVGSTRWVYDNDAIDKALKECGLPTFNALSLLKGNPS